MVFQLVQKWVEVDVENRQRFFERLLQHVRLPLCSPEFLCKDVEEHPFADTKECRKLIKEAKDFQLLKGTQIKISNKG